MINIQGKQLYFCDFKKNYFCNFKKNIFKMCMHSDAYELISFKCVRMIDMTELCIVIPVQMS